MWRRLVAFGVAAILVVVGCSPSDDTAVEEVWIGGYEWVGNREPGVRSVSCESVVSFASKREWHDAHEIVASPNQTSR